MTTLRQIEANRRKATKSTGPKTVDGKSRSRRNAIRHGLSAETVIEFAEDREDYLSFEATIIADYDPITAVERELVLRLASLLWRLRRATAIETDLFQIQVEILHARRHSEPFEDIRNQLNAKQWPYRTLDPSGQSSGVNKSDHIGGRPLNPYRDVTHSFQRQTNLDNGAFERLGRHEAALWRQLAKTLFILRRRASR